MPEGERKLTDAVKSLTVGCNKCYAVTLKAGEILYIPRFWAHCTFPESPNDMGVEPSIAVNVFFREKDLSAKGTIIGRMFMEVKTWPFMSKDERRLRRLQKESWSWF